MPDSRWQVGVAALVFSMAGLAMAGEDAAGLKDGAAAPRKFDTPVWHPDARWAYEGVVPMAAAYSETHPLDAASWQGPSAFYRTELERRRVAQITSGAMGPMDGPFSRARFAGHGYVSHPGVAVSPDRRYMIRTDPYDGGAVRVLDFKEQMVRTVLPRGSGVQALATNSRGEVLLLMGAGSGQLLTLDLATGKKVGETKLKAAHATDLGFGRGLALDEKRNRLYACGTVVDSGEKGKPWHVWYFDLNDGGSFHGVLKGGVTGALPSDGSGCYTGPFDGFIGYAEHSICWGPDDPEFRFLYLRMTDSPTFFRLDLERRIVGACSGPERGRVGGEAKFIESGRPNGTRAHMAPVWLDNGDFVMPTGEFYKRVK